MEKLTYKNVLNSQLAPAQRQYKGGMSQRLY